jgi:hypothetical protein
MKAIPITHRSTRSPLKLSDEALVSNDSKSYREFVDVAGAYAKGRKEGKAETKPKSSQRKSSGGEGMPLLDNPPIDVTEIKKP